MARKLGLMEFMPGTDGALIDDLLTILPLVETDMTLFFRHLATLDVATGGGDKVSDIQLITPFMAAYYRPEQLTGEYRLRLGHWLRSYIRRAGKDMLSPEDRRQRMNAVNPKYVLRNYLAQMAIDKAEKGDFALIHELLELLRHPYDEQPGKDVFAGKRPEWARHRPGCSMLSCSS